VRNGIDPVSRFSTVAIDCRLLSAMKSVTTVYPRVALRSFCFPASGFVVFRPKACCMCHVDVIDSQVRTGPFG